MGPEADLDDARAALATGAWDQAVALLGELDATPEVLELRAQAAYGAGDLEGTIGAFEELHRVALAAGDDVGAALAATWVAIYLLIDTALLAPIRGWVARAERLLDGHDETPVDAMLAFVRCYERVFSGDFEAARPHAAAAIELGTRQGVPPAVAMGRTATARLAVLDGRVDEGLALLDDVAVTLMSGELDPLTTGMIWCELVCAMQNLAQYDRAEQWTEAMERWSAAHAFGGLHGRCRVHRAEILRLRGDCATAEAEALLACDELRPWMRREFGWPLTELGNIRLRRGDLVGAEEAFLAADDHVWAPQPGLALLRLAQGDATGAASLVRNALDDPVRVPWKERPPAGPLHRAPLLDAQVEIAVATGDLECARAAAGELAATAEQYRSEGFRAAATLAGARVLLADGDPAGARRESEAAIAAWTEIGAPYEVARARLVLADALDADGDRDAAARQRGDAERALEQLCARTATPDQPATTVGPSTGECTFRRDGDLREIAFAGADVRVADLKGLRYLEILLAMPGRELHVLDLVAREAGTGGHDGLALASDAGPLLDETARDAYRRRLQEVEADIDEATDAHDDERRARAEADRDYLVAELARAFGLGGRARRSGAPAEKARTAVTRTLTYARERLAEHHPALAEHLRRSVRTGTYVAYEPDPAAGLHWDTAPRPR